MSVKLFRRLQLPEKLFSTPDRSFERIDSRTAISGIDLDALALFVVERHLEIGNATEGRKEGRKKRREKERAARKKEGRAKIRHSSRQYSAR
jgi:hypothetical protein